MVVVWWLSPIYSNLRRLYDIFRETAPVHLSRYEGIKGIFKRLPALLQPCCFHMSDALLECRGFIRIFEADTVDRLE